MNWTYPAMHVLLVLSAVIIAGLVAWLAYQIVTDERSRRANDRRAADPSS